YSIYFFILLHLLRFSFFFFYLSTHHRHLHSFPTRRSSDLSSPCGRSPRESRGGSSSNPRSRGACRLCGPPRCRRRSGTCVRARIDRKSTRLNSSHVAISYAVFCLKKKKYK